MGRVFSGVQPTGNLHLGNYLGAIRQWVKLQERYECLFCIVDYHAITVPQDPTSLREHTIQTAAAYMAAGIDPEKHLIFHQSGVPEHTELAWILSCYTRMGQLNRMTQFKEKAGKQKDRAFLGLFSYPVLMAADILLYKATHVPVGEDQKQHLELTREIAASFNDRHFDNNIDKEAFFPLPEPIIMDDTARIMSLRDGTKKMSKSDPSDMSRINLTDDADTIAKKIRKAKSDPIEGMTFDREARPEASNLLAIYAALTDQNVEQVTDHYATASFSEFKQALTEVCVESLTPVTQSMREYLEDKGQIEVLLRKHADKARELARLQIDTVKDLVGFFK